MRDFNTWFKTFRDNIADYKFYVDFNKIYKNVDSIKVELNILNSLLGSKNIKYDFKKLLTKYPETLKCIPILLAVRSEEIVASDDKGKYNYSFKKTNHTIEDYEYFMQETGLFDMLENHVVNNLVDYVTGVETGLDSNGRKNRGGHLMENLVEKYIQKAGFKKEKDYFKEINTFEVEKRFNVDLTLISNNKKTKKRFDFVIKIKNKIFLIETNFYSSSGSKLNETARSYKQLALEIKNNKNVSFIWITDGNGWTKAKHNLEETFDILPSIYNINDLDNGIFENLKVENLKII